MMRLTNAKMSFYKSATGFVDSDKDYYVSKDYNTDGGKFKDKNGEETWHYESFYRKHYGIDFGLEGGSGGNNIYAGLQGRVTDKDWYSNNGNCLQIQYGYTFEDAFIGTGIFGEYLHMQQSSTYAKDDYVNPNTILGKIGGTGPTGPKSYADHLHYDIFIMIMLIIRRQH